MFALTAALAAMAGGVLIPTSVKNTAPEVRAQQSDKGTPATNLAPTAPQVAQYHLPRSLAAYYRQSQPVWLGTAKRGNRINRSRWNYNR